MHIPILVVSHLLPRGFCASNHVFRYLSVRVELFDRVGGVAIVLLRWVNVVFSCSETAKEPRRTSTRAISGDQVNVNGSPLKG